MSLLYSCVNESILSEFNPIFRTFVPPPFQKKKYVVIASYNRVSIGFYNIAKVLTYAVLLKGKYVRFFKSTH